MSADLRIDRDQARRHLDALGGAGIAHIFAVFPEAPGVTARPRHLYGRFADVIDDLQAAQRDGCGVFVTVNAMHGRRRLKGDLARIRAIWAERDEPGQRLPLMPSLRIRTSAGKGHGYLVCDSADPLTCTEAERINSRIVTDFGGDKHARDTARVLRLAGSWHLKGEPQQAFIIGGSGQLYARGELLTAFPEPLRQIGPPPAMPARIQNTNRYAEAAINGVLGELALATQGHRNAALNRCAFRLGQLGIELDQAVSILTPTATAIGLAPGEIAATIRSGVSAGAQNIRRAA